VFASVDWQDIGPKESKMRINGSMTDKREFGLSSPNEIDEFIILPL